MDVNSVDTVHHARRALQKQVPEEAVTDHRALYMLNNTATLDGITRWPHPGCHQSRLPLWDFF